MFSQWSDWFIYFWPQIVQPFGLVPGIYNVPWLYIFLQPLRWVGAWPALLLMQLASFGSVYLIALRLGLSRWRRLMVLISPPMLWHVFTGQFDGLLLAAYFMPAAWSGLLFLAKPQVTIGSVGPASKGRPWLWLWMGLLVISAEAIWGWPYSTRGLWTLPGNTHTYWNWSPWPLGLAAAPMLIVPSLRARLAVSPLMLPYAGLSSVIGPTLAAATLNRWLFAGFWLALWVRWAFMMEVLR